MSDWFVVVERSTHDMKPLLPYVVGPYSEADATREMQSDTGIIFCLVTIDAKKENYVADDVYVIDTPPDGERIMPPLSLPY